METHEIQHRDTGAVLYVGGGESLRAVIEQAVASGANLACAYLAGAYLDGANLDGANLACANLAGANLAGAYLARANLDGAHLAGANGPKLIGSRPALQVGPIGSRCAYLVSYITDAGVYVRAGCWFGPLADFGQRVVSEHGDSVHGQEYAAAIAMIEAHARLWAPASAAAAARGK